MEFIKISLNPQSFNEKTLKRVNRYHDREKFDEIYKISKEVGLKINMDLILGFRENLRKIFYTRYRKWKNIVLTISRFTTLQ